MSELFRNIDKLGVITDMDYNPYGKLYPSVYKYSNNGIIDYMFDKYKVPDRFYGDVLRYPNHIFRMFENTGESIGTMFVGESGSGKTEISKYLCNLAIDAGYPVLSIADKSMDIDDIDRIFSYDNIVLFMDEFSKIINSKIQNKMLSRLSNIDNKRRLIIITENSINSINNFILNRPGRIRYMVEFGKLKEDVFNDYVSSFDIDDDFLEDLKKTYTRSIVFSFDHLKAIVSEHIADRHRTLDDIIDILNVKVIRRDKKYVISSIVRLDKNNETTNDNNIASVEYTGILKYADGNDLFKLLKNPNYIIYVEITEKIINKDNSVRKGVPFIARFNRSNIIRAEGGSIVVVNTDDIPVIGEYEVTIEETYV